MKKWWQSKTLWANAIGITAIIVQSQVGYVISPEAQATLLAVVNMALRAITNSEVVWR